MRLGSTSFVLVSGLQMTKEALVNQGENFLDRPEMPIDKDFFSNMGELSLRTRMSAVRSKH